MGGAEEGAEGDEAGAEDAEEEFGGGPPDDRDEGVCGDRNSYHTVSRWISE